MVEEAGFCPGRYEIKDHIFFILEVKETSSTTQVQKGSLEVQKGGASPHSKWCQLCRSLFTRLRDD